MKKTLTTAIWLLFVSFLAVGQTPVQLAGSIVSADQNEPLMSATIFLSTQVPAFKHFATTSDPEGKFRFEKLPTAGTYFLEIRFVGFQTYKTSLTLQEGENNLPIIKLSPKEETLGEVQVTGQAVVTEQKGDTVQFNARSFKANPDANAEDLLKKMPGITSENGTISAQGEQVGRVLVDGKEFFGTDPNIALKSLPAEVIDKIQVYDRLSDQSEFSGFNDGNTTKTINIITRPDKRNGQFGYLFAGYGTDDRYASGGNVNLFNGDKRISVIGMANNINQQNFSNEDLLGVVGGTNQRRGPGGGGRGGRGGGGGGNFNRGGGFNSSGNANDFLVGQQGGISETAAIGLNYSDNWGQKAKVNGSYFFNRSENATLQVVNQQFFLTDQDNQLYSETNAGGSVNYNHRFNFRMEYSVTPATSFVITPAFSLQQNEGTSTLNGLTSTSTFLPLNQTLNGTATDADGFNFSNNLLLRHRFEKRGRTASVNFRMVYAGQESNNLLQAENTFFDPASTELISQDGTSQTDNLTLGLNATYTEPLSENGQLQVSYRLENAGNNTSRLTYQQLTGNDTQDQKLDSLLSNTFNSDYRTQAGGLSYRYFNRESGLTFMAGFDVQSAKLTAQQEFPGQFDASRTFTNVLPSAMLRWQFNPDQNLRIFYRTRTNAPSVSQLQNVIDNSNPLQLTTGNPDLKQDFSHFMIARYSSNNTTTNSNFFVFMLAQATQNYLGTETIIATRNQETQDGINLNAGEVLTRPVNLSGYLNLRSFVTFGQPVTTLKSNLNFNGGITFTRTPGLINGAKNEAENLVFNSGLVLASNISEKVDFTLNYTANYTVASNTLQPQLNNNFYYHTTGGSLNLIFWKGTVFRTDFNHYWYTGLADGFNQEFFLWNMSIGKKFLKDDLAEIKLSVFDLLKQNNNLSRSVTETLVEDQETTVLQRYFMLTFSYKIRNFGLGK